MAATNLPAAKRRTGAHRPARRPGSIQLGRPHRSAIQWSPDGWIVAKRRFAVPAGAQPLQLHADWTGPTKLIRSSTGCWEVTEVFLSHASAGCELIDPQRAAQQDALLEELAAGAFARKGPSRPDGWTPPEARAIVRWLAQAGHSPAIDEQENLRLPLKSRGRDGQIRIKRAGGLLRLAMPLGAWDRLEPAAENAMLALAHQANRRARLVRIAWSQHEAARRCEAQVDLSGLPVAGLEELQDLEDLFWPDLMRLAVDALQLALHWLGMELDLLADPNNRALADQIARPQARRPRPPR